jgi:hypothetical protein
VTGQKKPVFGIISLVLMLGLIVAGALVTAYGPPAQPPGHDESLAVVIESAANIIATLLVIAAVSFSSLILAGVSFLRKEPAWPAAIGLCLSLSALIIAVIAVTKL